ncbi:anhydro-N-acetylmuramic acid kinase [Suttonella ornithocola]|uniref:Anhydro-N-acetylmuramic acid kinase n=1 Tax=Suttonella ornithocola TaxID=279832 RepID=A0A380MXR2_9GAMM|nr:anhydro-N-acetylmuramic acid kinase [Suttonella ornithocola]SUO96227.1 Anhydro-N-acetylmuramic acid kinase [Suttonella ornithocola]
MIDIPTSYYIGLMSGTSLDAVDAALVSFDQLSHPTLHATYATPFPLELKEKILTLIATPTIHLQQYGELDRTLGILFADAVNNLLNHTSINQSNIKAVGSHGQTLWHQPDGEQPFTLQIGDPHYIATRCGIDVIADFRRKDIALGGQGAPLVPAFHQAIFTHSDKTTVVLNIGGIANITVLRPNKATLGYDTGPGNMLIDAWMQKHCQQPYDKNALFAQQGHIHSDLLAQLKTDAYLHRPAPKSTGREHYHLQWLEAQLAQFPSIYPADVQRTLLEFTAQTATDAIKQHQENNKENRLIICGGGSHNPLLMQRITELLPAWKVKTSDDYGINSDYLEAIAFAWLAYRHIQQLSGNLPEVTGAHRCTILGAHYPAS